MSDQHTLDKMSRAVRLARVILKKETMRSDFFPEATSDGLCAIAILAVKLFDLLEDEKNGVPNA